MNDVMLICDSTEQANYEFELFKQCFPTIVRSSNKKQRKIVLNDGEKIFFENSNHGKTAFVGVGIDVFEIRAFKKALKRLYEAVEKIVKGDCNVCRKKNICAYVPYYGKQVRYNCPFFEKKEDAEHEN